MIYWANRILQAVVLLFGASLLVFLVIRLAPGDPATILADPSFLTEQQRMEIRQSLGLEDPLPVQYVKTIRALAEGDLRSFRSRESTLEMVREAAPTTFLVVFSGLLIAVALGIPLGILAGRRPGSILDKALSGAVVLAISFPAFVLGLVLIRVFAEQTHLLPASGIRPLGAAGYNPILILPYLVLPAIVTALPIAPMLARYTRDAVQETMQEDFVRTAYSKGLSEASVMWRHVFRNSLIPVLSVLGIITPIILGGTVIVEQVFALPGLGRITVQAALLRDYPVVITTTLFSALLVIGANLLTDFAYGVADPRIRLK